MPDAQNHTNFVFSVITRLLFNKYVRLHAHQSKKDQERFQNIFFDAI